MNYTDTSRAVSRDEIASFLQTATDTYKLIGIGVTDSGIAYNPQTTTEKWIVDKASRTSVDSYQRQRDINQKCRFGDPVYDFINELRKSLAIGSSAEAYVVDVDIYDADQSGKYFAQKSKVTIAINNYATATPPELEYTLYYGGDPENGKAEINNGVLTYTPSASV